MLLKGEQVKASYKAVRITEVLATLLSGDTEDVRPHWGRNGMGSTQWLSLSWQGSWLQHCSGSPRNRALEEKTIMAEVHSFGLISMESQNH